MSGTEDKIIGVYESVVKPTEEKNVFTDMTLKIAEKIKEINEVEPLLVKVFQSFKYEFIFLFLDSRSKK